MKIVLDTNLLVSGIFWGGTPLKILDLWKKKKVELLASDATLNEYLSIILKVAKKMDRVDLFRSWSLVLPARLRLVSVRKSFRLCRDSNDDIFIDCAIAGRARYIVTGDQDLLVLKQVMGVRIVDARHFLMEHSVSGV